MSTTRLIERARAGDEAAMEHLLTAWAPRVHAFGRKVCGNPDEAREVLQETLLAAFRGLAGFRGDASISTWLFSLARNACTRMHRRAPDAAIEAHDAVVDPRAGPDEALHAHELGAVLRHALESLSAAHREVLLLKDVEGRTVEDVAALLGEDVAAVKSRLHRARLAMRARLRAVLEPSRATLCPTFLAALDIEQIDRSTCEAIAAHLAQCRSCGAANAALLQTVTLCRSLPGETLPAPIRSAIRHALSGPRP